MTGSSRHREMVFKYTPAEKSSLSRISISCPRCIQPVAITVRGNYWRIVSVSSGRRIGAGLADAGHETAFDSRSAPAAKITGPCRDGLSHHPDDWHGQADPSAGAAVRPEAENAIMAARQEQSAASGLNPVAQAIAKYPDKRPFRVAEAAFRRENHRKPPAHPRFDDLVANEGAIGDGIGNG